jgi:hypothetical protein
VYEQGAKTTLGQMEHLIATLRRRCDEVYIVLYTSYSMHNMHQTILKVDTLLCVSTSTMPTIRSSILEARGTAVIYSDADRTN